MGNDTYGIVQVRPCFPVASKVYVYWHMVNDTYGIMQIRPCVPVASKVYMINDTYGIMQVRPLFPGRIWRMYDLAHGQ